MMLLLTNLCLTVQLHQLSVDSVVFAGSCSREGASSVLQPPGRDGEKGKCGV